VAEAKRQVAGVVGIDGLAGPSELVVVMTDRVLPYPIALDLLAQGEHGPDSLLVAIAPDRGDLNALQKCIEHHAPTLPSVVAERVVLVQTDDVAAAVKLADELAPEHLQLSGAKAEALAGKVRSAGCVFVGVDGATAFGDYVAGSNHVLPTGGAARFQSALSPATFRRRMARVSLPDGAAVRLAPPAAALARAEGFPVHGKSMEERTRV
jgi:histidinol dehydrogenase